MNVKPETKKEPEICIYCGENYLGNVVPKEPKKLTKTGKILLSVAGGLFVGVYIVAGPFIAPGFRKISLPFVPASSKQIQNVMSALKGRKGTLLDIGSGDGRIVIEAAKNGYKATGVELNPWLVLYSKWRALRCGVQRTAKFETKDLWKTNVGVYDNIVIFGVDTMMKKMENKFNEEVFEETRIVTCRFPLPTWEPVQTIGNGIDAVWLYKKTNNQNKK